MAVLTPTSQLSRHYVFAPCEVITIHFIFESKNIDVSDILIRKGGSVNRSESPYELMRHIVKLEKANRNVSISKKNCIASQTRNIDI